MTKAWRSEIWTWMVFAALKLLIHVPTSGRYGYFRDELYYMECADRLAWGYVDQPPFSLFVLRGVREVLGDSVLAIRLPAILAGVATIILVGLFTKMLGGGRFAQAMACLAALIAPVYLVVGGGYFSMNAFDVLFWTLAVIVFFRIIDNGDSRLWLWFGVIVGLGLLNKLSMLFLGFGVLVALASTQHRRQFRSLYLWLSGAIVAIIFLPHLLWQAQNGWPTLEFMSNAAEFKNAGLAPHQFLLAQLVEMHPINAVLWIAGAVFGLFGQKGRYRVLSITFLTVLAFIMVARGKAYYLAPAFPMVLVLGAIWLEGVTRGHRILQTAAITVVSALGAVVLPMAVPVLSVDQFLTYQEHMPLQAPAEERGDAASLPQHLADRFGWEELVRFFDEVFDELSEQDRERCSILVSNYGEAGALNFFGPENGLPRAISGHNNHYIWGPGEVTGEVVLVYLHADRETLQDMFDEVVEVGRFHHPLVMPYQTDRPLFLCRGLRLPIDEVWPLLKRFI